MSTEMQIVVFLFGAAIAIFGLVLLVWKNTSSGEGQLEVFNVKLKLQTPTAFMVFVVGAAISLVPIVVGQRSPEPFTSPTDNNPVVVDPSVKRGADPHIPRSSDDDPPSPPLEPEVVRIRPVAPVPPPPEPEMIVEDVLVPTRAGPSCLRYAGGGWSLIGSMNLNDCVQAMFDGQCEQRGGATYGRWGDQTLRLVKDRVEISSNNRIFRTLVDQGVNCSIPEIG